MEILEAEVEFLTDEVEEIEVDVNQVDDRVTLLEETVIGTASYLNMTIIESIGIAHS